MSDLSGLAEALIGGEPERLFRLGEVESVNPGPPRTLTVDGRAMRYLFRASVTDIVLYVDEGNDPFVLGKLSNGDDGVPIGATMVWHTATAPPGWLPCDGRSTSGYPDLAAVVGANVPDMRDRFPVGAGGLGLGATAGVASTTSVAAHTHGQPSHSHSQPTHDHFMGHVHGTGTHRHPFSTRTDNQGFHNHILDIVMNTGATTHAHHSRGGRLSEAPFEGAGNANNAGTVGNGGHTHGLAGDTGYVSAGGTDVGNRDYTTFDGGESTGASGGDATFSAGIASVENRPPCRAVMWIIRAV